MRAVKEPDFSLALGLFTAAVSLLGPTIGPSALLIFAAVIGAALAMSKERGKDEAPMTRWEGVKYIALGACVSLVLTGLCVYLVQRYTDIPANIALMPLAFFIALSRGELVGLSKQFAIWIGGFIPKGPKA